MSTADRAVAAEQPRSAMHDIWKTLQLYRMQNPERVRTYGAGAASPSSLVLEVYRALRGGSRPTWSNWRLGVDGYGPYRGHRHVYTWIESSSPCTVICYDSNCQQFTSKRVIFSTESLDKESLDLKPRGKPSPYDAYFPTWYLRRRVKPSRTPS
jgi:hypothetical protein